MSEQEDEYTARRQAEADEEYIESREADAKREEGQRIRRELLAWWDLQGFSPTDVLEVALDRIIPEVKT